MKQLAKAFLALMAWVNDGLPDGESGHSLEFGHLNSFQIDRAKKATSVMNEFFGFALGNHWTMLQMNPNQLASVYFAGMDKTGEKADTLGLAYRPIMLPLGRWGGEGSFPRPTIMSVESGSSRRVALVMVSWGEVTVKGYGDWATAEFTMVGVYEDHDDAEDNAKAIGRAYTDLEMLAEISADRGERRDDYTEGGLGDF